MLADNNLKSRTLPKPLYQHHWNLPINFNEMYTIPFSRNGDAFWRLLISDSNFNLKAWFDQDVAFVARFYKVISDSMGIL